MHAVHARSIIVKRCCSPLVVATHLIISLEFFFHLELVRHGRDGAVVDWAGPLMLLLLRDYASPDYAKWTILERDYATYYASVIRYATRVPSHFLGRLC